jgi:hypothetical protein
MHPIETPSDDRAQAQGQCANLVALYSYSVWDDIVDAHGFMYDHCLCGVEYCEFSVPAANMIVLAELDGGLFMVMYRWKRSELLFVRREKCYMCLFGNLSVL